MDESTMDSQEGEDEPMEAKTIQVYRQKGTAIYTSSKFTIDLFSPVQ